MRRQVSGGIRSLFFLAATGLLVVASGCGDDDGGSGPGVSPCDGADDCAATYFQALSDSLAAIPDNADEDTIRALRFPDIRAGFDAILAADPGDRIAHLGSGILDILELNHSPDLWAFVDSLSDYADEQEASAAPGIGPAGGLFLHPGSPILRNQFTILATAPRDILRRAALAVPSNLSVANLQSVFETEVIPALSSAIGHFEQAEADGGPTIPVTVDDETHEIDLGEILVFHAATLAARAGFRIATAYDLDLPGPSGDYSWIEGMIDIERCQAWSYFQPKGADEYRRVVVSYDDDGHPADAAAESVAVSIVQYNLESRAGFLTQRSGGMAQAWSDLQTLRDLLEQANASIQAETDDQMDD
ncbi:MAG TPA: hypothetical protein VKU85_04285, partial [bacterium]|nr:hypothetical protein [bacterium]